MREKKTIWTLNVGGTYAPEITAITYKFIKHWAGKIGARFEVITERKFPEWPDVYEKLQIFELGRSNDWNIYIDSDAFVHPDMYDPTEVINPDTVLHNGVDFAPIRWSYDGYFRRDGRNIGSCNWFAAAHNDCLDLWRPSEQTLKEAVANIHPTQAELASGMRPEHLIDDYTLSRNIARFGLKVTTISNINKQLLGNNVSYLWHIYATPVEEKLKQLKEVITAWSSHDKKGPSGGAKRVIVEQ